uniref:Coat protein n=1 Tax=Strawberry necrotic shock virus TaxID=243563 RepID=Q6URJ0_9BROM|nr:coat protein [Strawberry necrotic shock virus]
MSVNRGKNVLNNNSNGCPTCFDKLDAAANNCARCMRNGGVSNRQRRNARRAANFRNQRPVPVVPVSAPTTSKSLKLPGNQVWVTRKPSEWAAKTVDTNDAITLKTIFNGIPEINDDTKIFRVLIGFVAVSDGTFGLVDGVVGDTIPDPPIIGRLGFKKNTYRSRDFRFDGKLTPQVTDKAIVWCLDSNRRDAKRVRLADFWIAISRLNPLMPPDEFLSGDSD